MPEPRTWAGLLLAGHTLGAAGLLLLLLVLLLHSADPLALALLALLGSAHGAGGLAVIGLGLWFTAACTQ